MVLAVADVQLCAAAVDVGAAAVVQGVAVEELGVEADLRPAYVYAAGVAAGGFVAVVVVAAAAAVVAYVFACSVMKSFVELPWPEPRN